MNKKKLLSAGISLLLIIQLAACAALPTLTPSTPVPREALEPAPEVWDLVFISDSSGWGVAEKYAAHIEADLGIEVAVHDEWRGGLAAGDVLWRLERPDSFPLAGLVAEAEVVVFYANPQASVSALHPGDWNCVDPAVSLYAADCSPETFEAYHADLQAIYAEIFALRGDRPVIIRTFDAYAPLHTIWREQGVFDGCLGCWETYNQVIHEAAAAYGVPVAPVFETFNGPDHAEDPRDKGYIGPDGIHCSDEGRAVIASLLRDLGYEITAP